MSGQSMYRYLTIALQKRARKIRGEGGGAGWRKVGEGQAFGGVVERGGGAVEQDHSAVDQRRQGGRGTVGGDRPPLPLHPHAPPPPPRPHARPTPPPPP